ncbi:hypothetical protein PBAL39_01472 [Pedobacter sp. BAL39]|uniref:hypothetical protein n=1 Tax=Pedobacter sp. BAL39 TaxID=391596 RepID=UPI00015595CA|nr:hypothetical protein [Pedobacter sp. BAL39]EDM38243.1 hypothetical protein PBAL39_01472 [Pedobacter sp. BAL39]
MSGQTDPIKTLFFTGAILLGTIAAVLLVISVGFFVNVPVGPWQFPFAFLLSSATFFYFGKASRNIAIKAVLISISIIIASILCSLYFYDVSYDGQSYHMEGIYQLKNGWNPVKALLPDSVNMAIYINHYAKGVELPQSAIYSMINKIEAGKATNLIILAATFCLTLSCLLSFDKLPTRKSILIGFIACFNPVTVNQLISTYVDGQLSLILICFLVTILLITRNANPTNLMLLSVVIIIAGNIKFTSLVYIVLFSAAFLLWLLINKRIDVLKSTLYTALASGLISVAVVGYNPYLVNTTEFGHPFYPLMGKKTVDIMTHNLPNGFEGRNMFDKFFTSLFARTDNVMVGNGKEVTMKLPFSINKTDVVGAYQIDTRIAGFGPLFSAIFILSHLLLLMLLIGQRPGWHSLKNWIYFLGVITVSIIIIPESWWARYTPQLWCVPLTFLLMTERLADKNRFRFLKTAIYVIFLVNMSFTLLGLRFNWMMTRMIDEQMHTLKAAKQPITVNWGASTANRVRFMELGIPYVVKEIGNDPKRETIICSDAEFLMP